MKINSKTLFLLLIAIISFAACDDDDDDINYVRIYNSSSSSDSSSSEAISDTTIEANRFVYEIMSIYYYWNTDMFYDTSMYFPKLDYTEQNDTEEYFEALLSDDDYFSFITDDAESMYSSLEGVTTSMGWDYTLMYYSSGSDKIIAIVNYVFEGTPAETAGAKRGDIIMTVNGTEMVYSNYSSLMSVDSGTFGVWRYDSESGSYSDVEYTMTAAEVTENVVAETAIFDNIGYLLYYNYYSEFNDDLIAAFAEFQAAGVTDLILDLRYNTGGETTAISTLCSMIAPIENVTAGDEIIYYEYNDLLTTYYPTYYCRDSSNTCFNPETTVNLDLDRIVIITGSSTYSASEATIIGLKPYMDVYCIGYTTGGKNSAMFILTPEDFVYSTTGEPYFEEYINNWMIAPICAVYYNSQDYTFDASTGIEPDYTLNEYKLYYDMGTLGSADEPLTAAAIEYLTEGSITSEKSVRLSTDIISHKRSKIEGLIIDNHSFKIEQ